MKPEKHTQLCEHIADRLNEKPDWNWECNKQRTLSMEQVQGKIETLNWHFWIGKEVAQVIRATDVMPEQVIDDIIMSKSQELAEYACGNCGNIIFTPKL